MRYQDVEIGMGGRWHSSPVLVKDIGPSEYGSRKRFTVVNFSMDHGYMPGTESRLDLGQDHLDGGTYEFWQTEEPIDPVVFAGRRQEIWNYFQLLETHPHLSRSRGLIERLTEALRRHHWQTATVTTSIEEPHILSWADEQKFAVAKQGRRRGKFAVMLKKLRKEGHIRMTDDEIEKFAYAWGETVSRDRKYEFVRVTGDEVVQAYENGPRSCMRGQGYVRWYANNPENVGLLKIVVDGKFFGRAIVWDTDEGVRVIDRIYPNHGFHIKAVHEFAESQGWDYRPDSSKEHGGLKSNKHYHITLNNPYHQAPYHDTFYYAKAIDGGRRYTLTNNPNDGHTHTLTSTGGSIDRASRY